MPEAAVPKAPAPYPAAPGNGTPRVVMAFDFGRRRIGVACGDTVSRTAAPESTMTIIEMNEARANQRKVGPGTTRRVEAVTSSD